MYIKKIIYLALVLTLLLPQVGLAELQVKAGFNAGNLISDTAFADTETFGGADGIQQFLESKNSVLARTDTEFLVKLREETDTSLKTQLEDPNPALNRLRTAAELIYDASRQSNINPQVLVVTLQKEQSLITASFSSEAALQKALDRALGYGCPDGGSCQVSFLGFYNQLFGMVDIEGDRWLGAAKSLSRSFYYQVNGLRVGRGPMVDANNQAYGGGPYVKTTRKGDTLTFENEIGGFTPVSQTQTVTMENFATTALYRYTPHVFNGNYNFWRFYQEWFRYPNGTVISLVGESTLWVIDNGYKKQFSQFVANQRGINTGNVITVSQTELSSYPVGPKLTPKDGTLVRAEAMTITYLIESGKRHKITELAASQRNLNFANTIILPVAEVESYELGSILLPLENTLIKSALGSTVYMILGKEKRPVSYGVFVLRKLDFAQVHVIPDIEVNEIPEGNLLPPPNNTLVKGSSPAVYLIENSTKKSISYPIFVQKGFNFSNVVELSAMEMEALTESFPVPPAENTLIKTEMSATVYAVWQGSKIPITGTVYNLREYYKKEILTLSEKEVESLPQTEYVLSPKDGSLVKFTSEPAVYLVENSQLRLLTYEAFINRNFKFSQIKEIPLEEKHLYEKGQVIAQ